MTQSTQQDVSGGNVVADKRVDFGYNAAGQFTSINRYANLAGTQLVAASAYSYDGTGRLTALSHTNGGTTFAGYGWAYDAANRITAFTNSQYSAEDATYSYDDTDQLTGVDRTGSGNDESYVYDDNGNRVTANGASYTTNANNQLASDGTYNYTYDDEGNTLTKVRISGAAANDKTVEYTWDHRNRLTAVTFKNNAGTTTQKVNYTYDAYDRLIGRTHDTDGDSDIDASVNYLFDGQHVALALADNGTVQNRYLHGPMIDMVRADEQVGGSLLWTLGDNQGTIRDVATYNGGTNTTTVVNHRTFNSFGKITAETNAAVDSLFAYTGRILDETTGDQNNRARWYSGERWLSEDPIGFDDGANIVAYVHNDPVNASDPFGHHEFRGPGGFYRPPNEYPPVATQPGFYICSRKLLGIGTVCDTVVTTALNCCFQQHTYVQWGALDVNGKPLPGTEGLGIGGGSAGTKPSQEGHFLPANCIRLKRKASAQGKSDEEIWNAIKNYPMSKDYEPFGENRYNCEDWAIEAADAAGLEPE